MKFCVIGDPADQKPRFSSSIIVSELNKAAKLLGLFDENGIILKWDGCCNTHGDKVDVLLCSYELLFPDILIRHAGGRPILGVSSDNYRFIRTGGHPEELTGSFRLGVDSELFYPVVKTKNLDKFVVALNSESLVRGGFELGIEAFGKLFADDYSARLIIKDRNSTDKFREYVKQRKKYFNIDLVYLNEHWLDISTTRDFYQGVDCVLQLNRSSTFNMPVMEALAMSIPTIVVPYSGPRDYCNNENSCLVYYELSSVSRELQKLIDIGCRNYFFLSGYPSDPVWARADIHSVMAQILSVKENRDGFVDKIKQNARKTAEEYTWHRSAQELSKVLERWF
ncbi:MAG: glycosyltransferase [Nanoarchaeota archaeon]